MTFRLPLLVAALALVAVAGCEGAGDGPSGDADLSDIASADPFDQLAYNAGFETARQLQAQDSSFSFDRFRDGFHAGLRGDSSEIAYALGLRAGLGLRADTIANIDANVFLTGMREALQGDSIRLTPQQLNEANSSVEDSLSSRQLRSQARTDPAAAARLQSIGRNQAQADSFLAAVARQPGVQRTESGLLYKVNEPGQGPSPTDLDQVRVEYVGRFPNGEVFDRSPEGQPVDFPVRVVVPGFAEALKMMKPGAQWTVYLPPDLAYGLTGAPGPGGEGGIPPNKALEFDLRLVEILDNAPQQGMPNLPQGM